jgi:serpin B
MMRNVALLTVLLLLGGCAGNAPERSKPAVATERVDAGPFVRGSNRFAFELYQQLSKKDGNLFLSPYSITTALALTSAGTRGETAEQMASVLHQPPREELQSAAGALMRALNDGASKNGYQLSTANSLWGAQGFPFRPEFLVLARKEYGAELTNLEFGRDAEGGRQAINRWVEQATRDKIRDLISPGVLNGRTRLVLANAIYFKGNWDEQFRKDLTKQEPFRTASGNGPKVAMMNRTGRYGYAETDDVQALSLPYVGKELEMLVLLPKKDDLAALEQKLSAESLSEVLARIAPKEVMVALPRFKTTAEFELSATLKAMGMPKPFDPPTADFSGLTSASEPLAIDRVIHKARVEVNEEGAEAAAATAVVIKTPGPRVTHPPVPIFRADHPFIYLIRDTRSGSMLFLGRLADPSR